MGSPEDSLSRRITAMLDADKSLGFPFAAHVQPATSVLGKGCLKGEI